MPTAILSDDLQQFIGHEPEPTGWMTIDQSRINAFADCTGDHQFIHVDPEAASKTPFGSTIAHGFLTLSLLSHFAEQLQIGIDGMRMAVNYGLDRVRFINPVRVNQRVRVRARVMDIVEKAPGQFQVKLEMTMEIQGEEKPALIAEWLVMQFTGD
ncbi:MULTISPECIES: MaoC family dehydratase [Microbulbifer]|uniref:MaoC family dehydratase n=1 Tax=Microbulbifer TaxID=48073 RepID=UPI001E414D71|nr:MULTISPECIES: MaoC family dehydratase [Microbulbifer]UHQ56130.1 MaoC family dehydratase [Microbulbifer sp. YPW16]